MKIKRVMRYDKYSKIFRLFRIIWKRKLGAGYGHPKNYYAVFKMALSKKPFYLYWKRDDKVITFLWIRFTFEKNFGGILV